MPRALLTLLTLLTVVVVVAGAASCATGAQWQRAFDDAGREIGSELAGAFERAARQLREAHMRVAPAEPFVLRRRELDAGSRWGKDGVWLDRVSELFAARLDVTILPRSTRISVWTLGDDVVAAEVQRAPSAGGALIAAPAFDDDGAIRFFDERGASLDGKFVARPVAKAFMASGFGPRTNPFTGKPGQMHTGIDLSCARGTRVVSVGDGVAAAVGEGPGTGRFVIVKHHNGMRTKYFHLDKHADGLVVGKRVAAGELIGLVGSTGMATGPHLHFEVVRDGVTVDPARVEWPASRTLAKAALVEHRALVAQLRAMTPDITYAAWPGVAATAKPPPAAAPTATTTARQGRQVSPGSS
jgi:murein DD-endopeptidase MepM/ murein hydrolase activator NlpD